MTAHAIKHNQKPTAAPPSTVISDADNHLLPPLDDDDENDAYPANLMGKYNGGGNKKVKGGHSCRYRDDDYIKSLHGLYKEPKENDNNGCDNDDYNRDWDDMEEKEREYDDGDDDSVVDITAVRFFGMTDKEFLGKETDNKKKKEEEEEKRKGDENCGGKKRVVGVKRGKKTRGGINRSASKGGNEDDAESWDEHNFDVGGKEGAE